jgi:hypothetical protein
MQHEWKVERLHGNGEEPDMVCLNCGMLQLPENADGECVPSQAWMPPQLELWNEQP